MDSDNLLSEEQPFDADEQDELLPKSEAHLREEVDSNHGNNADKISGDQNEIPLSYRVKLLKTCCMLLVYLGLGLWAGVITPTIVDMVQLYNCTYESFTHSYTMKAVGVMTGSFLGATIADRFRPVADLFLFLTNFIGGATFIAVPWLPNLVIMAVCLFFNGLAHGTINVVCSSINIAIWGKSAATPIHALHMLFTIGLTISPPLALPFLSKNHTNNANISFIDELSNLHGSSGLNMIPIIAITGDKAEDSITHNTTSGDVWIPYAFMGGWSVLISFIFLLFFFCGSTYTSATVTKKTSLKEMLNPGSIAKGNMKYGLYFMISLFILYIFIQGRDRGVVMFLFVIANQGSLHMSKPLSAAVTTVFNLCTAFGRGLSGLLVRWISINIILFTQLILACLLQVLLIFYGLESSAWFWSLICLSGLLMGPTYPSVMSWSDKYIEASGVVIAIIDIGIGTGSFISLWLSGTLFQHTGATAVFILTAVFGGSVILVLFPLQIISCIKGDRHKQSLVPVINEEQSERE